MPSANFTAQPRCFAISLGFAYLFNKSNIKVVELGLILKLKKSKIYILLDFLGVYKLYQKNSNLTICITKPIKPIINIPSPLTLTIVLNSIASGFFVILRTLRHSPIKDFTLYCQDLVLSASILIQKFNAKMLLNLLSFLFSSFLSRTENLR